MGLIYGWVKDLVVFYILMTAVLHLLPKNSYQKYVRFFGGLLLVALLLTPVLELLKQPESLLDRISYESFWQEMDTVRLDMAGMEQTQRKAYQREYEKAIAQDVTLMAQDQFLVLWAEVEMTEEYQITNIALSLVPLGQEEGIAIEKITFQYNTSEYPGVLELKQKIMDFYQVGDGQIQIMVEG